MDVSGLIAVLANAAAVLLVAPLAWRLAGGSSARAPRPSRRTHATPPPLAALGQTAVRPPDVPPGTRSSNTRTGAVTNDELIDIDRVEGRVKASSVKKVGEIVDKHPDEALSIIRAWMYQEG